MNESHEQRIARLERVVALQAAMMDRLGRAFEGHQAALEMLAPLVVEINKQPARVVPLMSSSN